MDHQLPNVGLLSLWTLESLLRGGIAYPSQLQVEFIYQTLDIDM